MNEALKEWLENPTWRKYYEEAPSEKCREYITLEFRYSDTEDEEIAEEMDALLETLKAEDLRHLAAYAGNNPERAVLLNNPHPNNMSEWHHGYDNIYFRGSSISHTIYSESFISLPLI